MNTRVQKYKGHSYIAFNLERPGSLTCSLTEADFPNLNQHDLETINLWLKAFSSLGVPTRIFLKSIRQYIYEMLHDFSIDYELAHECKYEYTLKPKTYMKKLEGRPPGIVPGCGLLYAVNDEVRLFRFNDKHMYPTSFLEAMIQHMTVCFQELQEKSYVVPSVQSVASPDASLHQFRLAVHRCLVLLCISFCEQIYVLAKNM